MEISGHSGSSLFGTWHPVGFWASLTLCLLCVLSTAMGWNAYRRRSGGDAAGMGMARGFHDLLRLVLNVAAFVGAGCFLLARVFPAGALHGLASALGWLLLPPTLVLFVGLLRGRFPAGEGG